MAAYLRYFALLAAFLSVQALEHVKDGCSRKIDVVVILEVAAGRPSQLREAEGVFEDIVKFLRPKLDCTRMSLQLIWEGVEILTKLSCDYNNTECFPSALKRIEQIRDEEGKFSVRPFMSAKHIKNDLIEGIEAAGVELKSGRADVEKIVVLILSNAPQKGVMPTHDALKEFHDNGFEIMVIGVGDGQKEALGEIVLHGDMLFKVPTLVDLQAKIPSFMQLLHDIQGRRQRKGQLLPELSEAPVGLTGRSGSYPRDITPLKVCYGSIDAGFLMDWSGSMTKYIQKEKDFVKEVTMKIGLSAFGNHAGAVQFSEGIKTRLVIPFNKYNDSQQFNNGINQIDKTKGGRTLFDEALTVANTQLFTTENGSRYNATKVLLLITDGRQNPKVYKSGKPRDPAKAADKLHARGISIYAIAIGSQINTTELELITRSKERVYFVKDFKELLNDTFIKDISEEACSGAEREKIKTVTMTIPTPSAIKAKCSDCSNGACEGCTDGCPGCALKKPVYLNIFNGNSKNYIMQGAQVSQTGSTNSISSIGFKDIEEKTGSSLETKTKVKDMTSMEIINTLKKWLPYQKKMRECIQELTRRSINKANENVISKKK